jgi:hypothetical protein
LKIDKNNINNMLQLFQILPELFMNVLRVKVNTPRPPVKPGDNRGALYIIVIREYPRSISSFYTFMNPRLDRGPGKKN